MMSKKIKIKKITIPEPPTISSSDESDVSDNDEIINDQINDKPPIKRRRRKPLYEDSIILDRIVYELNEIKKEINGLRGEVGKIGKNKLPILVDIKRESLEIDIKMIKAALKVNGILGDMMIFKSYYLKNELKPIRNINLRHYEYWCNGKWIIDHYGKDIMDII